MREPGGLFDRLHQAARQCRTVLTCLWRIGRIPQEKSIKEYLMKNTKLFLLAAALLTLTLLAACSPPAQPGPSGPGLAGDPWILVTMNGEPVVSGQDVTLQFGADGNLGGNASCNSYFAPYQVDGTSLVIGQPGSTMMLCVDEGVMQQETRYLSLLPFVRSYTFKGENLVLLAGDGQELLEYRR
jgi:heat shock protein HslJ